jgi:cation diffusion facilitator family transporter
MHIHNTSGLTHDHHFAQSHLANERRTWWVVGVTLLMMGIEIAAGLLWNSMALLADGWHMGTHALALGVAGFAYWLSRRHAKDARYSLGPWKIEVLGAYTSATILALVALWVGAESVMRLLHPAPIQYQESLIVAVLGLVVNLVCALLLQGGHGHAHAGHSHDLNLRAAYMHVIADALTSILAIAALLLAKYFGWVWADALIGLLGAVMILRWAKGLILESAGILLDREMDHPLAAKVRAALERDGDTQVTDLHLSRVGPNRFSCHATTVADAPHSPTHYRARLAHLPELAHVTIECNRCQMPKVERAV